MTKMVISYPKKIEIGQFLLSILQNNVKVSPFSHLFSRIDVLRKVWNEPQNNSALTKLVARETLFFLCDCTLNFRLKSSFRGLKESQPIPPNEAKIDDIYDEMDLRNILDGQIESSPCLWHGCAFIGISKLLISHIIKMHVPFPWSGIHRSVPDELGRQREYICYWKDCKRRKRPFLQRSHFIRHIKSMHCWL